MMHLMYFNWHIKNNIFRLYKRTVLAGCLQLVKQALKADKSPAGGLGAGEMGLQHIAFKAYTSKTYTLENVQS